MITEENKRHKGVLLSAEEISRIPYYIGEDEFSTYYPSRKRIDKLVREIDKYIKYKKTHLER